MDTRGSRLFRCNHCNQPFSDIESCEVHISRNHPNESCIIRTEWIAIDQNPTSSNTLINRADTNEQNEREPGEDILCGDAQTSDAEMDSLLEGLIDYEEELNANLPGEEVILQSNNSNPLAGHFQGARDFESDFVNYRERFCPLCLIKFSEAGYLDLHRYLFHPEYFQTANRSVQIGGGEALQDIHFRLNRSAGGIGFGNFAREYEADMTNQIFGGFPGVTRSVIPRLVELARALLQDMGAIRLIGTLNAEMQRHSREAPEEMEVEVFPFHSFMHTCLEEGMIHTIAQQMLSKMSMSLDAFIMNGSGWKLKRFISFELRAIQYRIDRGAGFFKTPKVIRDKHCIISIRNSDNLCFKYSILAELMPLYKSDFPDWYTFTNPRSYDNDTSGIFWDCINFPMTIDQLDKFHHFNPQISVNVFGYEDIDELNKLYKKKKIHVFPLYICKSPREKKNIDLLLIIDGDKSHYTLLRQSDWNPSEGLSRLLGKGERNYEKYICRHCMCYSTTLDKLKAHQAYCFALDLQRIILPTERFYNSNHIKQTLPVPFVIYLDFEAILEPRQGIWTRKIGDVYSEHIDCGWSYVIVGPKGYPFDEVRTFCGRNAALKLIEELVQVSERLFPLLKNDVGRDPTWTLNDYKCLMELSTNCIHCGCLLDEAVRPVVDHCHITSCIRGISCNDCNLQAKLVTFIPIVCHGFRHYDSKFIMQAIRSQMLKSVEILASSSTEKFTALRLTTHSDHVFRMIDSFQFISSSLADQVQMMRKEGCWKFQVTASHFGNLGDEKMNLLYRKGVYPYQYFNSFEVFDQTNLPPAEAWKNDLTGELISQADFEHAHKVWKEFGCKTLRDYHNLYVTLDTCLLADCFQSLRNAMLKSFRLDPAHYLTLPGIAFDAAMLSGRVSYEYLDDVDKYMFFEGGIRGGICSVGLRHAKANNKYLGACYDPNQPSSYICFWDANLLYSTCLRNYVPWKNFRWDASLQNRTQNLRAVVKMIMEMEDNGNEGIVLEVDLDYPSNLHDWHNDYPLAVERVKIDPEMLSVYTKTAMENVGATASSCKKSKLVGNLHDKRNYTVHYRLLKLYLELGLKLVKVHRAIRFTQAPLFRVYTDICIERRRQATSEVDKKFYKAMGNILAGKVYQNVRKYRRINVGLSRSKMLEYAKKPTVENVKIIHDDCVLFVMRKLAVRLDKPVYVGQCILDDSKRIMYSFYYKYLKAKYGDKMRLIYTDTDSFLLRIFTDDVYKDISTSVNEGHNVFDTSNYDKEDATFGYLWSNLHQGAGGFFKDETPNAIITEAVALKPKVYAIQTARPGCGSDGSNFGVIKKAKGTIRAVVNKELEFEDYKKVLQEGSYKQVKMNTIRSLNQRLYTTTIQRRSLSAIEDKAFYLNPIESLKFGHYRINEFENLLIIDELDECD